MTLQYFELAGFENVYLEDSFVLDISARPGTVTVHLELVLTEQHSDYSPPPLDERYCYRRATICFGGVRRLNWIRGERQPSRDANNEIDFGGVDQFVAEASSYSLTGDFGELVIEAERCRLEILPPSS